MIITVLQRRHVAIPNEKSIKNAVNDDIECEMGGEGECEHGQRNTKNSDETSGAVGEGDLREVAAEHAEISEYDSHGEDDG